MNPYPVTSNSAPSPSRMRQLMWRATVLVLLAAGILLNVCSTGQWEHVGSGEQGVSGNLIHYDQLHHYKTEPRHNP